MHGSVREGLENLLAAKMSISATNAVDHVSGCDDCASELEAMRSQSQMFKTLQPPIALEPTPGFYARVMQRIEESAKRSIWWVFVYSPVGKRLAFASLALTLALGSYVVAAESYDGHLSRGTMTLTDSSSHYDFPVVGTADEQRAAVMENFAAHPSATQEPAPSQ